MSKKMKKERKIRLIDGLPVVDAERPIRIHITSSDVKNSRKNDPANCAAAKALNRELGVEARVHISKTYLKIGKKWVRFQTPNSVSREIVAFDRGAAFEPGEYTMPVPSTKLGQHRSSGPKEKKNGKSTRPYHATASIREWAKGK